MPGRVVEHALEVGVGEGRDDLGLVRQRQERLGEFAQAPPRRPRTSGARRTAASADQVLGDELLGRAGQVDDAAARLRRSRRDDLAIERGPPRGRSPAGTSAWRSRTRAARAASGSARWRRRSSRRRRAGPRTARGSPRRWRGPSRRPRSPARRRADCRSPGRTVRSSQPLPPPSTKPPTPVVETRPPVVARPYGWVARSRWLIVAPPSTRTDCGSGMDRHLVHPAQVDDQTAVVEGHARHAVAAAAHRDRAGPGPARTARTRTTSASFAHCAITAGRRSIIALKTDRASS